MSTQHFANTIGIILGAGQSTRMKSTRSKLLHDLCGKPVIRHLTDLLRGLGVPRIIVIVGHDSESIMAELGDDCEYVVQEERLGTGHAVMQALPLIRNHTGNLLIFPGDSPFLTPEAVQMMIERQVETAVACSFLTTEFPVTPAYGRVIRNASDMPVRIVEDKDCTPEQKAVREVFTSHYCLDAPTGLPLLEKIDNKNAKNEYYLTDLLGLLSDAGHTLEAVPVADYGMTLGINDRADLAMGVRRLQDRFAKELMLSGVTIIDPASTYIDVTVTVEPDTVIYPGSVIQGSTTIGGHCTIGPSVHLVDATIGAGSSVRHAVLTDCTVPDGVTVKPFQEVTGQTPVLVEK
jgi:bifunctional UDP-N-acetylglucosamine pyrophosphorylase / glucosamine-1-phosphate N-acetyltransferase